MKAFVLTKARTGDVKETVRFIRKIGAVRKANVTFGPYDVIIVIEAGNLTDIGKIVVNEIQPIPGVEKTLTCLAMES